MGVPLQIEENPDGFTRYLLVYPNGEAFVASVNGAIEEVDHTAFICVIDAEGNSERVTVICEDDDSEHRSDWTILTADEGADVVETVEYVPGTWDFKEHKVFLTNPWEHLKPNDDEH